jgi:hypothetical protein
LQFGFGEKKMKSLISPRTSMCLPSCAMGVALGEITGENRRTTCDKK